MHVFIPNHRFTGLGLKIFLHFLKSFIPLHPQIKYSFRLRVFDFIKKGGEIRLMETLATNPE
jgi:hypothetical protein